jgi:rhodanese-related sulfurtransferase
MTVAHVHAPGFLRLVDDAKSRIREITIDDYRGRVSAGDRLILVDVREDHEWEAGHLPDAVHVGRGILERDVEHRFPDKTTPLVLQCGGGFRSALACDNLQRMGYTNVRSLAGGYRAWVEAGLPVERGRS